MTTFLVFNINARKEVEMYEIDVLDESDETGNLPDLWHQLKPYIRPPYQGKTFVVEKDHIRTFRLKTEVIESKQ